MVKRRGAASWWSEDGDVDGEGDERRRWVEEDAATSCIYLPFEFMLEFSLREKMQIVD